MGDPFDGEDPIALESIVEASKAIEIHDTEGDVVERTGREITVFGLGKDDLVMLVGVARQKDHLTAARCSPIGDQEAQSLGVKRLHSRQVADPDLEMAQRHFHV